MKPYLETWTGSQFEKSFHVRNAYKDIKQKMHEISKEELELTTLSMRNSINIPIKKKVFDDYDAGNLIVYTVDPNVNLPTTIPISLIGGDPVRAIINVTPFISYVKDPSSIEKKIKVEEKKLFTYLSTAWVYRKCFEEFEKISKDINFVKVCANMYAKLIYAVLDKTYSVGRDISALDKLGALAGYFFAKCVCGVNHTTSRILATSLPIIRDENEAKNFFSYVFYKDNADEKINDFGGFCTAINEFSDSQSAPVDPLKFMSEFAKLYNGQAVPAIDYFPYFAMLIISSYIGGGVGKDLFVSARVKTEQTSFMTLLYSIFD